MSFSLRIVGGTGRGTTFDLPNGIHSVGRDAENPIQIDSGMVSRHHAEIRVNRDQVILKDLQSANGTIVNQQKIEECQLHHGDKIYIGDSVIEFLAQSPAQQKIRHGETVANIPRPNLSPRNNPVSKAADNVDSPLAPFLNFFKNNPLIGISSSSKGGSSSIDWKIKIVVLLLTTILLDHLIISKLFTNRLRIDVTQASLKRARDTTRYLAEKNKFDLAQGNETLLDTEVVMNDEGVLAAFIANSNGRILVPTYKLNQQLGDETSKEALSLQSNDVVQSPRLEGGIYRFAAPIRVYRETKGNYETIGVAVVLFSPKNVASSIEASKKVWLIAIALVPVIALILFFMIQWVTLPPINYLIEMIGKLFRGEVDRIDRKTPIAELRPLIDTVNAAAMRFQQEQPATPQPHSNPPKQKDFLDENTQLKWLLTTLSEAVLVLNNSGTVLALNPKARALLGIDAPVIQGRNFEEVISNQNYKTFLRGCFDDLKSSGRASLTQVLESGDFAYQFTLHSRMQATTGELEYVTVIVEKI